MPTLRYHSSPQKGQHHEKGKSFDTGSSESLSSQKDESIPCPSYSKAEVQRLLQSGAAKAGEMIVYTPGGGCKRVSVVHINEQPEELSEDDEPANIEYYNHSEFEQHMMIERMKARRSILAGNSGKIASCRPTACQRTRTTQCPIERTAVGLQAPSKTDTVTSRHTFVDSPEVSARPVFRQRSEEVSKQQERRIMKKVASTSQEELHVVKPIKATATRPVKAELSRHSIESQAAIITQNASDIMPAYETEYSESECPQFETPQTSPPQYRTPQKHLESTENDSLTTYEDRKITTSKGTSPKEQQQLRTVRMYRSEEETEETEVTESQTERMRQNADDLAAYWIALKEGDKIQYSLMGGPELWSKIPSAEDLGKSSNRLQQRQIQKSVRVPPELKRSFPQVQQCYMQANRAGSFTPTSPTVRYAEGTVEQRNFGAAKTNTPLKTYVGKDEQQRQQKGPHTRNDYFFATRDIVSPPRTETKAAKSPNRRFSPMTFARMDNLKYTATSKNVPSENSAGFHIDSPYWKTSPSYDPPRAANTNATQLSNSFNEQASKEVNSLSTPQYDPSTFSNKQSTGNARTFSARPGKVATHPTRTPPEAIVPPISPIPDALLEEILGKNTDFSSPSATEDKVLFAQNHTQLPDASSYRNSAYSEPRKDHHSNAQPVPAAVLNKFLPTDADLSFPPGTGDEFPLSQKHARFSDIHSYKNSAFPETTEDQYSNIPPISNSVLEKILPNNVSFFSPPTTDNNSQVTQKYVETSDIPHRGNSMQMQPKKNYRSASLPTPTSMPYGETQPVVSNPPFRDSITVHARKLAEKDSNFLASASNQSNLFRNTSTDPVHLSPFTNLSAAEIKTVNESIHSTIEENKNSPMSSNYRNVFGSDDRNYPSSSTRKTPEQKLSNEGTIEAPRNIAPNQQSYSKSLPTAKTQDLSTRKESYSTKPIEWKIYQPPSPEIEETDSKDSSSENNGHSKNETVSPQMCASDELVTGSAKSILTVNRETSTTSLVHVSTTAVQSGRRRKSSSQSKLSRRLLHKQENTTSTTGLVKVSSTWIQSGKDLGEIITAKDVREAKSVSQPKTAKGKSDQTPMTMTPLVDLSNRSPFLGAMGGAGYPGANLGYPVPESQLPITLFMPQSYQNQQRFFQETLQADGKLRDTSSASDPKLAKEPTPAEPSSPEKAPQPALIAPATPMPIAYPGGATPYVVQLPEGSMHLVQPQPGARDSMENVPIQSVGKLASDSKMAEQSKSTAAPQSALIGPTAPMAIAYIQQEGTTPYVVKLPGGSLHLIQPAAGYKDSKEDVPNENVSKQTSDSTMADQRKSSSAPQPALVAPYTPIPIAYPQPGGTTPYVVQLPEGSLHLIQPLGADSRGSSEDIAPRGFQTESSRYYTANSTPVESVQLFEDARSRFSSAGFLPQEEEESPEKE